jgi:hypothetical protein
MTTEHSNKATGAPGGDAVHQSDDEDASAPRYRPGEREQLVCSSCGTGVPEGRRSCPVCHRGVYRTCFCGWQLPATAEVCPNCDADWSQSTRVARKSKSHKAKTRSAIRYAVIGALGAVLLAFLAHWIISALARVAADGTSVPSGVGQRISLAAEGLVRLAGSIGTFFARNAETMLLVAGIMLAGAIAGIGIYMVQRRSRSGHTSRTSRRVRRKRRK